MQKKAVLVSRVRKISIGTVRLLANALFWVFLFGWIVSYRIRLHFLARRLYCFFIDIYPAKRTLMEISESVSISPEMVLEALRYLLEDGYIEAQAREYDTVKSFCARGANIARSVTRAVNLAPRLDNRGSENLIPLLEFSWSGEPMRRQESVRYYARESLTLIERIRAERLF